MTLVPLLPPSQSMSSPLHPPHLLLQHIGLTCLQCLVILTRQPSKTAQFKKLNFLGTLICKIPTKWFFFVVLEQLVFFLEIIIKKLLYIFVKYRTLIGPIQS